MRVGIIGCGYWGPNLARNIVETGRCETVYAFDADPRRLATLVGKFPLVLPAASLDELIECCDAVIIATPVSSHYSLASKALAKNKAVFVEKPMATSSEEAAALVEMAHDRNLTLMVGHTFIYSPAVRKIKEYIDSGRLGDVYFLSSSRVNLGIHRKDVDVVWDLAPHDISIFLYWLGANPKRVAAVGRTCVGNHMDVASLHMEFASGALANIEVSWLAPGKLRRTVVVGTKSMVLYDDTETTDKVRLCDRGVMVKAPESFGEFQLSYRTGDVIIPKLGTTEPLLHEMNEFVECVATGRQAESDGIAGLNVVLAIEAACRSIAHEGRFMNVVTASSKLPSRPFQAAASAGALQ